MYLFLFCFFVDVYPLYRPSHLGLIRLEFMLETGTAAPSTQLLESCMRRRVDMVWETNLLPHTGTLSTGLLPLLVRLTQRVIQSLDPGNLGSPVALLGLIIDLIDQISQALGGEEFVLAVVQRPRGKRLGRVTWARHAEYLLQDVDVVGDGEQVPAVLVGEEVVELVEAGPGDAAQTEGAGLVGGEEDTVFWGWARLRGGGKELLDAVDLAVQKGRCPLVVGCYGVRREIGAGEDRGAEELGSGGDAGPG